MSRGAIARETTNSDSNKVARKKSEGGVEARLRERKRTATATRLRERKAKAGSRRDQSDSAKPFPKRANRHRDVAKKRHHHQPAGRETRAFHKETDNLEDLLMRQNVVKITWPDEAVEANLREGSEFQGEG